MILYSKSKEKLDTSSFVYFDEGSCATVYKKNNTLLKVYGTGCNYRVIIERKLFNFLKEKNISNIVKLYDYYYYFPDFFSRLIAVDAYTMQLVSNDHTKFIDFNRTDIIDILKSLEETINILTDNRIIMYDVHPRNIITNKNGITIIDPDRFYFSMFSSKKKIYKLNKCELMGCLNKVFLKELANFDSFKLPSFIYDDSLSFFDNINNSLNTDEFQKILSLKK
jgi:hypothetical protein